MSEATVKTLGSLRLNPFVRVGTRPYSLPMLAILATFLLSSYASAENAPKQCTEADIRQALAEGREFHYVRENCANPEGIIEIRKGIRVRTHRWTFDGAGVARLVWKGEGGCDKFPRNSDFTFFAIEGDDNTLKNFSAEGAPEGLHVLTGKRNTLENVHFPFVCEDAITNGNKKSSSATETRVLGSTFKNSTDKAIQINGGQITVENCEFRDVFRSIGACAVKADPGFHEAKPCGHPSHIVARRNRVYGCNGYGMRAAGAAGTAGKDEATGGTLLAEFNVFTDCREPLHAEEKGLLIARHNEFRGTCKVGVKTLQLGSAVYGPGNVSQCTRAFEGNVTTMETIW